MKTNRPLSFFTIPLFAVVATAVTQPAIGRPPAPFPPSSRPPAPFPPNGLSLGITPSYRDQERAWRDIRKAEETAYRVSFLATQASIARASDLTSLGNRLLSDARGLYEAGKYFQAAETARAAKNVHEAAQNLYEGQLGYVVGPRGEGVLTRSYYDAPYRVSEELYRADAIVAYYRSNDSTVSNLLRYAREFATPSTSPTASIPSASAPNLSIMTNNRAAIRVAKAAIHLVRAANGI